MCATFGTISTIYLAVYVLRVDLLYFTMKICEIVDGMVNLMKHSMWEKCISRKFIPEVISSVAHSLDLLCDVLLWIMWGC